jgi:thiosulfate oxidation carrier complex protein SoxZ
VSRLHTPRLSVPDVVVAGQPFEVRVMVAHEMETGFRRDLHGQRIPRHIVTHVRVRVDDEEVLRVDLGPGVAANPYFSFQLCLDAPADLRVDWQDDDGAQVDSRARIDVRPRA